MNVQPVNKVMEECEGTTRGRSAGSETVVGGTGVGRAGGADSDFWLMSWETWAMAVLDSRKYPRAADSDVQLPVVMIWTSVAPSAVRVVAPAALRPWPVQLSAFGRPRKRAADRGASATVVRPIG